MSTPKIAHETTHRVTIRFDAEPPDAVQETLKAHGWRYSRNLGCWWVHDTPDQRAFAVRIIQEPQR